MDNETAVSADQNVTMQRAVDAVDAATRASEPAQSDNAMGNTLMEGPDQNKADAQP